MKTARKIRFLIYNEATGRIRCTGVADPECIGRMIRPGEAAITGRQGDPDTQRVVMSAGRPSVRKRGAADIEAARSSLVTVDPVAVFRAALEAKGITISDADLLQARSILQRAKSS